MDRAVLLDRSETAEPFSPTVQGKPARIADDVAMLRTAAELTRDINAPRPVIYWSDFLASSVIGYAASFAAMVPGSGGWGVAAAVIAVLALFRAGSFIHEVAHIKHSALPGFRLGWNLLVGIPMLVPSFLYEGVHSIHHTRTRFGTADDPEYLPLALMKPWTVPLFVAASLLAPVVLIFRFAIVSPLTLLSSKLRGAVVARYSTLAINPAFRRRPPEGELKRNWLFQEVAASAWAITMLALVATGVFPMRAFLIFLGVAAGVAVLNQVRTLVAHLWENDGDPITVTAQYLDSVNVPPPTLLPALWAPVGLRYHAVHHLLPSLPYHSLGEAYRRLSAALAPDSPFHAATARGLPGLVGRLIATTFRGNSAQGSAGR